MIRSCDAFRRQIDARLDGELTGSEQSELERHLDACAACRNALAQAEAVSARLAALGRAADAIAAAPSSHAARRRWYSASPLRIAAAIGLIAAAGLAWRLAMPARQAVGPGPNAARQPESPRGGPLKASTRTVVVDAGDALAVPIQSDNPRVQIVMFYEPAGGRPDPGLGTSTAPSQL
jgi:anti-sigma factor RsiW